MNAGRIRLNVGGTIFETTELTLGRLEGTVLKTMMDERWSSRPNGPHNDELFIDRDATHFRTILNFLRDGTFTVPKCEREVAEIEREAEVTSLHYLTYFLSLQSVLSFADIPSCFYGISELAEACRSQRETVKVGDTVTWRSEVI
uniref:BTB domain-containing protein n=1 Tax=Parascaris equorum TaxID=6256 RepID=A0A914R1Q5_PAREQ